VSISIAMTMAVGLVFNCIAKVGADLSGYLDLNRVALFPCYGDTDLSGNLVGALDRLLVALSVLLGMALGSTGVSVSWFSFGVCFTLLVPTMSTMTVSNNLGVVTNNSRAVVDLGGSSVALSGEGFFTLLNVGSINNGFADRAGNLALILDWLLVALSVLLVMALRSTGISRLGFSLSITLAISVSSMSVGHNLGVMTNNSRAVVDLLRSFFAMGGDDVFAFLNISGVNDDVIFLMTLLTLVLDWFLVTLLVGLAEALKVVVVVLSISGLSFSLSFTLVVSAVSMRNNLRIMTNNSRAVVDLLRGFLAVLSHNILALLNISGVHNNIVFLMASLVIISLARGVKLDVVGGVALALLVVMTGVAMTRSSLGKTAGNENT